MCHYHSFISTYSHIFSPPLSSFLCTQLLFSHLNSNQLSGTIPDSIGNLVKLSQLYVCGNIIPYLYQHLILTSFHDLRHKLFCYTAGCISWLEKKYLNKRLVNEKNRNVRI